MTGAPKWVRPPAPWRLTLGAAIVSTEAGEQVLEGPAAALWELLGEPVAEADLVRLAADAYDLSAATTRATLRALAGAGLCTTT